MPQSHSLTVTARGGLLRELVTECSVCAGFDPELDPVIDPAHHKPFKAIWDTGATNSVVTQNVVDACGLVATGMIQVHGVNSTDLSETYLVNILLPNGVGFVNIKVTKGKLPSGGSDILIGMDIITMGDFSVTNKGGTTVFSFRVPSQHHVDFVKEHQFESAKESKMRPARIPNPGFGGRRRKK